MQSIRVAVAAVGLGFLAASVAKAEDAPGWKDPWVSFKPGSTATYKTTSTSSVPGAKERPALESRMTLVSVPEKEYVLRSEMKVGEAWTGRDLTIPRKAAKEGVEPPKVEELGEEKVTVDGTEYACKKTKITILGTTRIAWVHKELGALKSEGPAPGGGTSSMVVTSLSKKFSVGGKDLVCKETTTTMPMAGSESTIVKLANDSVPGAEVRTETNTKRGPMTTTQVKELTAFEAK